MDTNSMAVDDACADLLKRGQRQMRYRLKKTYFDGVPANEVRTTSPLKSMTDEQWTALVVMLSETRHKDKCVQNKVNGEKVQFQQRMGSRSYIAHCLSLEDMEAIMVQPLQEGEEPKFPSTVVSQVLPSTKFLQSVGLQSAALKRSAKLVIATRVQELEAELEFEKQGAADLREIVGGQQQELYTLKKQIHESEVARNKGLEETENLKKATEETNALLRHFLLEKV